MIRSGFLSETDRQKLIALARDGSEVTRLTKRANALVLLDQGLSCVAVAAVLLLDDDTVRGWHKRFAEGGIEGLSRFEVGGSSGSLNSDQEATLKRWISETLPRTSKVVGAYIAREFGIVFKSRSGVIELLKRLDMHYRKPRSVPRKIDVEKQEAFIAAYNALLNSLGPDEAVLFADAVHPTHAARAAGCWAPKDVEIVLPQNSGRDRLNVHGAIDLETGKTAMNDVLTVDADSTIMLLEKIEALFPLMVAIHVFLDNARYHHADKVASWLAQPGRRIKLHFVPSYCPHLNPIERLWGVMHKNVTHNRCYNTFREFADTILGFLRHEVPTRWPDFCDRVTDNFRVINPEKFRVVG